MKVRIPVLRETWDRVENAAGALAKAARSARRMGTELTEDDLAVARAFPEPDDRDGYTACRRIYRESMVGRVLDLEAELLGASGIDWSAVVGLAVEAAQPAKLPVGERKMVDVHVGEGLVRRAHAEASRLMGREAISWEVYLATTAEWSPRVSEFVRKALLEGDQNYRAWRAAMETWDGLGDPPRWPELPPLEVPEAMAKVIGVRWTAERVLGAWTDMWAREFSPVGVRELHDSLTVAVDGQALPWRSLYYRGVVGRKMALPPWSVEQEAWIRGKIREARKSLRS